MVRAFKLINKSGETFDLMRKDAFFSAPDGLGFSMNNSYVNVGSNYMMVDEVSEQKTVTGEMMFQSYDRYEEFARFVADRPLRLLYMPNKKWLYLNCTVTRLDKSEISPSTGYLHCPIDFTGTSKWYIPDKEKPGHIQEGAGFKTYDYTFIYKYGDDKEGLIELNNDGTEPAPCIISIYGHILNPTWKCYQNGDIVSSGTVSGTIELGHKLVINAEDDSAEIAEYTSAGEYVQNKYQDINFDEDNFLYAPVGYSRVIVSGEELTETVEVFVQMDRVYETL